MHAEQNATRRRDEPRGDQEKKAMTAFCEEQKAMTGFYEEKQAVRTPFCRARLFEGEAVAHLPEGSVGLSLAPSDVKGLFPGDCDGDSLVSSPAPWIGSGSLVSWGYGSYYVPSPEETVSLSMLSEGPPPCP